MMRTKPHYRYHPNLFSKYSASIKQALRLYELLDGHNDSQIARHQIETLKLCPANSVIEHAVMITARDTDIPPSLTYFVVMAIVGAALTQEGFIVRLPDGQAVTPNAWIICLAGSGAGKTFGRARIAEAITSILSPVKLPDTMTAAYMFSFFATSGLSKEEEALVSSSEMEQLMFRRCRGLLIRDEIGEWLKRINQNETQAELKDYLLRAYDGSPLTRASLARGEQKTGDVAMSLYGTAVDESFFSALREEDFVNGLMQRFQIVLAHDRPCDRIPLYQLDGIKEAAAKFEEQWAQILAGPREYVVTAAAIKVYEEWFHRTWRQAPDQESYIRRYSFAAFKYALILRAVVEPDGTIDASTIENALRIVDKHLSDLYRAMTEYTSVSTWHHIRKRVTKYLQLNPKATRSDLLQGCRGVGNSNELNGYLETIADAHSGTALGVHAKNLRLASRL